jgi:protein CLEC16A
MSFFGGFFKSTDSSVPDSERFSVANLKAMHQVLLDNEAITCDNYEDVVETLRKLSEIVVYGDKKSEILFDYFCEKNMLGLFLKILQTTSRAADGGADTGAGAADEDTGGGTRSQDRAPHTTGFVAAVHVQILQTLSILCQCVRNPTSLYYLLSNNYINEVLEYAFDFENDEGT